MEQSTKTIKHEETLVTPVETSNSPDVLIYRVSQLEKAAKENMQSTTRGMEIIGEKLDKFVSDFATKKEVEDVKLYGEKQLAETRTQLEKDISSVKKPVWAFAGIVLTAVILAIVNGALK